VDSYSVEWACCCKKTVGMKIANARHMQLEHYLSAMSAGIITKSR